MILKFYYRSLDKKLHQMDMAGEATVEEGFKIVMKHLYETKEVFLKPLLCLIKCGQNIHLPPNTEAA